MVMPDLVFADEIEALRERIKKMTSEQQAELLRCWPEGTPSLKVGGHTPGQLSTLSVLVADIEKESSPFNGLPQTSNGATVAPTVTATVAHSQGEPFPYTTTVCVLVEPNGDVSTHHIRPDQHETIRKVINSRQ